MQNCPYPVLQPPPAKEDVEEFRGHTLEHEEQVCGRLEEQVDGPEGTPSQVFRVFQKAGIVRVRNASKRQIIKKTVLRSGVHIVALPARRPAARYQHDNCRGEFFPMYYEYLYRCIYGRSVNIYL
jgi:hypothetical protein